MLPLSLGRDYWEEHQISLIQSVELLWKHVKVGGQSSGILSSFFLLAVCLLILPCQWSLSQLLCGLVPQNVLSRRERIRSCNTSSYGESALITQRVLSWRGSTTLRSTFSHGESAARGFKYWSSHWLEFWRVCIACKKPTKLWSFVNYFQE